MDVTGRSDIRLILCKQSAYLLLRTATTVYVFLTVLSLPMCMLNVTAVIDDILILYCCFIVGKHTPL